MITPEQIRSWAQDADDGEDVALDGDTLREIADSVTEMRCALEWIAQSNDAGRHDGLPEECPAHDEVEMWGVARYALRTIDKG